MFDELAVKNIWPSCQRMPEIMQYFPNSLPKGRLPDRQFFWTVLNTLNTEYVSQLIAHATSARNEAGQSNIEEETIVITNEMAEVLKDAPMISCKWNKSNFFVQRKREGLCTSWKRAQNPFRSEKNAEKSTFFSCPMAPCLPSRSSNSSEMSSWRTKSRKRGSLFRRWPPARTTTQQANSCSEDNVKTINSIKWLP